MSPTNWHAACLVGYPSRPQPERHSQTALAIAKADTAPAIAMRPQAMATSLPQPTAGTGRLPAGTAIAKAATAIAIAMAAYQQRACSRPNCAGSAGLAWVRVRGWARLGQG